MVRNSIISLEEKWNSRKAKTGFVACIHIKSGVKVKHTTLCYLLFSCTYEPGPYWPSNRCSIQETPQGPLIIQLSVSHEGSAWVTKAACRGKETLVSPLFACATVPKTRPGLITVDEGPGWGPSVSTTAASHTMTWISPASVHQLWCRMSHLHQRFSEFTGIHGWLFKLRDGEIEHFI